MVRAECARGAAWVRDAAGPEESVKQGQNVVR